jgi:hypothetical protein
MAVPDRREACKVGSGCVSEIEADRARILDLLRREDRAMPAGEIAARLAIQTHKVLTAMHLPLQRGGAWFHPSDGYSLPPTTPQRVVVDEAQPRLA